jgi:hypothetical protein
VATSYKLWKSGYRTLDDVANHPSLNSFQKLGIKYGSEINSSIPRSEVEAFERVVRGVLKV